MQPHGESLIRAFFSAGTVRNLFFQATRLDPADGVERNFYYEGIGRLPSLSDREEAVRIEREVIARLDALPKRSAAQNEDLRKAHHYLREWTR